MKEIKQLNQIKKVLDSSAYFITTHIIVIMAVVVGATIGYASIKTRSYLDIKRDESRFTEAVTAIKYKMIDSEILDSFKEAGKDSDVSVNPDFDPTRDNPFSE